MKKISSLQILLSSLLIGLSTISCNVPTASPDSSLQPKASSSPSLSTTSSPSPQHYVEATPLPNTEPEASAIAQNGSENSQQQPDPSLTPGQPNPAVQASRIKEPYENDGSAKRAGSSQAPAVGTPLPPKAPGKPQAPKSGIPEPPKPGVPEAPTPGKPTNPAAVTPSAPIPVKPQEPRAVIPTNPKPAIPQVKTVRPTSPSKVQVTPAPVQQKSGLTKSKVKINLKNLPDKQ